MGERDVEEKVIKKVGRFFRAIGILVHAFLRGLGIPMPCLFYGIRRWSSTNVHQVLVDHDGYQVYLWLEVSPWSRKEGFRYHFQPAYPECGSKEFGPDRFEKGFSSLLADLEWEEN
jgi:hypothetical protein